jgi:hypothetical protein
MKKPNQPELETDPRFPSGPWTGFWIQQWAGKQKKMQLSFIFCEGRISGEGRDIIGKFSFSGQYDLKTGRCLLTKQYLHAHRVEYDGVNEGQPLWLWGLWTLGRDKGGFHLWPAGEPDPTQQRTATGIELPSENQDRRQRVPSDLLPF